MLIEEAILNRYGTHELSAVLIHFFHQVLKRSSSNTSSLTCKEYAFLFSASLDGYNYWRGRWLDLSTLTNMPAWIVFKTVWVSKSTVVPC